MGEISTCAEVLQAEEEKHRHESGHALPLKQIAIALAVCVLAYGVYRYGKKRRA